MSVAWPEELIGESDEVLVDERPDTRFTVVAIYEDRAWVKDVAGRDEIVYLDQCRLAPTFH
jgi:hypothetical protein